MEECLGDCAANLRLRATSEFVYEDERRLIASEQHAHIAQVGTIGRKVVVDRLVVADVDEDAFENTHARIFVDRWEHSALHHVLNDSHGFQCHRLAAGIRPRNHQYAALRGQTDVERNDFLVLSAQRLQQSRMNGMIPFQGFPHFDMRQRGVAVARHACFGGNKIKMPESIVTAEYRRDVGAYRGRELLEDARYLAQFLDFKFACTVVGFHHFRRFDIACLAGSRFIVYDALDLPFMHRRYR